MRDPQQRGALGTFLLGDRRIALRQSNRAEQYRVGFFAQRQRAIRQRLPVRVNSRPTDGSLGNLKFEVKFPFRDAQNPQGLAHYFRADAVAGQGRYFEQFHLGRRF